MSKRVLVLGSGSVSRPCVQYLLKQGYEVIVVDLDERNIERTLMRHPNGKGVIHDGAADSAFLIREHKPDVVVCLLPTVYMTQTARACVEEGVHMIGASYVSDELRSIGTVAREKGIKILCEMGLDPGIDHMSAVAKIKEIEASGGTIESFVSMCGALPDLASNNNPIGYKLSWAPASLIGASLRNARIMTNGEEISLPNGTTYQHAEFYEVAGLGWFEAYANADSLPYIEAYGIGKARTIKRGTLRYFGWCDMITQMQKLGLFDERERNLSGYTYSSLMREIVGGEHSKLSTKECVAQFLGVTENSLPLLKLQWLGLLDVTPIPPQTNSLRGLLADRYAQKLIFMPGEKDIVIMQHEYIASFSEGGQRKKYTSTMVELGLVDEDTAIARTTGLPLGVAAHLVISGVVKNDGVLIPTTEDIYKPALKALAEEGLAFRERETVI